MDIKNKVKSKIVKQHAEKAMWERIAYYSIAIVGTEKDFEHGTGVPITYNGRYFIITCSHIIGKTTPDKLRFIWRTQAPLIDKEKNKLREGIKDKNFRYNEMRELPIKTVHKSSSKAIDLVAIELNAEGESKNLVFFELNISNLKAVELGLQAIMMGYAGEIAEPFPDESHKEGYILFLLKEVTEIISSSASLPNFYAENHFLMKYYADYCPKGLSGCGIWAFEKKISRAVWCVEPKLIGILSAYYPSSKCLKGEKADNLFKLLNRNNV